jgi:transposase
MVSEQKSSLPLQVQQCVNDLLDTLIVLKIILLNMTGFCPRKTDHRSQRLMELKGIGPTTVRWSPVSVMHTILKMGDNWQSRD